MLATISSVAFDEEFYSLFSAMQNLDSKSVTSGVIFSCLYSAFCHHEEGPSSFLDGPSSLLLS